MRRQEQHEVTSAGLRSAIPSPAKPARIQRIAFNSVESASQARQDASGRRDNIGKCVKANVKKAPGVERTSLALPPFRRVCLALTQPAPDRALCAEVDVTMDESFPNILDGRRVLSRARRNTAEPRSDLANRAGNANSGEYRASETRACRARGGVGEKEDVVGEVKGRWFRGPCGRRRESVR